MDSPPDFSFLVYSPADLPHCGLALTAARAGAVAILDFEFASDLARARENLQSLNSRSQPNQQIGFRLSAHAAADANGLSETLRGRPHFLVLGPDRPFNAELELTSGPVPANRRLLIEVAGAEPFLGENLSNVAGLIACGTEAGGWVSESSVFILMQKLLKRHDLPIYVRGVGGIRGMAASRIGGARGAVLDSHVLLMRESPIPESWRDTLRSLGPYDTALFSNGSGLACRVARHGSFPMLRQMDSDAQRLEASGDRSSDRLHKTLQKYIRWDHPEKSVWPVGQTVGLALQYAEQYGSLGQLLSRWPNELAKAIRMASKYPFAPDSPLAVSHKTRYPIVQGAMTRVSDNPQFAKAVADAGALPLLALALLRGKAVSDLLDQTSRLLAGRSWGVGLLGFVPQEIREEQIRYILQVRPPFALIAGGRPDQAAELEQAGIPTYLHVPVPSLLKDFLSKGVRRFVFEGRESGGHVGPLGSCVLWESMVDTLLDHVPKDQDEQIHVLFSGGIYDSRSAAMASVFAAPLAQGNMRVGVLMGTAYLFTQEAVETGAVVGEFQREAVNCQATTTVESGPGHANRCAVTNFVHEFNTLRHDLLKSGATSQDLKFELDKLTLGRLRVATKGKKRGADGDLITVNEETQRQEGMYMIGEAATLRSSVLSMAQLHHETCEAGAELVRAAQLPESSSVPRRPRPANIAIVGISVLLPGASDLKSFWSNVLANQSAITEIPRERWDWRLLYEQDKQAADKSYSRWGGFFPDIVFDPVQYGIPPDSVKDIGVPQLLALEIVRRALNDAGYEKRDFDRERTAVILAEVEHGGVLHHQHVVRALLPFISSAPPDEIVDRLSAWTSDSFPGSLSNITAGRVANRFDFGGSNFVVDAACASSLVALDLAMQELVLGRSDMVITGGIDTGQHPYGYVAFSQTQALSESGRSRPFDKQADGIVISEGVAIAVLKRLDDAQRDGDRIYAVLQGVAGSSDGKAMGMTAPRPAGQMRALRRCYERSGLPMSSVEYYEAHGTGTPVGDAAEIETVTSFLQGDGGPPKSCVIGSVKGLIGHTKTAAGIVGVIKSALALHHQVQPGHVVETPLDALQEPSSPLCLLREARPWFSQRQHPRRAAVSAFGFGGTNSHAVLEEYRGGYENPAPGADQWPSELVVFRAESKKALTELAETLIQSLPQGTPIALRDVAKYCAQHAPSGPGYSLAIVANDIDSLRQQLAAFIDDDSHGQAARFSSGTPAESPPVAFLFPGQGVQRPNMGREAALFIKEFRAAIQSADENLEASYGRALSDMIFPPTAFDEGQSVANIETLTNSHVAQPAIGVISTSYARFAERIGVKPKAMAGHSYGDFTALHAAGAISWSDFLHLSELRGRVMSTVRNGMMAAVAAPASEVQGYSSNFPRLVIAACNAPDETVISGSTEDVESLIDLLEAANLRCKRLQVSGAFHSPMMAQAQLPFSEALQDSSFRPPVTDVYSSPDGTCFPPDESGIRLKLQQQMLTPVNFSAIIERMYEKGVRVFLDVGPGNVLKRLVGRILKDKPHHAISLDGAGLRETLEAVGKLWLLGAVEKLPALFADRCPSDVELAELASAARIRQIPDTAYYLNGFCARPVHQATQAFNKFPFFNNETRSQAATDNLTINQQTAVTASEQSSVETVYESYQTTMRQFLKTQEQVLSSILGITQPSIEAPVELQPVERVSPTLVRAEDPQAEIAPQAPIQLISDDSPSADDLRDTVLETVSELTGYPIRLLKIDADLEAELGIDSIRRLEIINRLQQKLPSQFAELSTQNLERLARSRTLHSFLDILNPTSPPAASAGIEPTADPVREVYRHAPSLVKTESCPRYAVRAHRVPLTERDTSRGLRGTFIITGEVFPELSQLVQILKSRGANPIILAWAEYRSAARIEERIGQLLEEGPIAGVIHLAAAEESELPSSLEKWRELTHLHCKSLFLILRACSRLNVSLGWVISVSNLGGLFGREGLMGVEAPSKGAAVGLLNSYQLEYPATMVKSIDLDKTRPPKEQANAVVNEMLFGDSNVEVGYPGGVRHLFSVVESPLEHEFVQHRPEHNWIFLVTGGARGITAKVIQAMAIRGQTMVIVGRSNTPIEHPELLRLSSPKQIREFLIHKSEWDNQSVRPADIEHQVSEVMRSREISDNLQTLRKLGVNVHYHAVDVRSSKGFVDVIEQTYRKFGRIDAVIHGAGIIADKLLIDKNEDSFDAVFDTKADSAFLLFQHLRPEDLKLMMFFASTAARFGNRGQMDYAAANEVLNRFAWTMDRQWDRTRVASINWGPWLEVGMASAMISKFRTSGITPINPHEGSQFAVREAAHMSCDIEVIAGDGPWHDGQPLTVLKGLPA